MRCFIFVGAVLILHILDFSDSDDLRRVVWGDSSSKNAWPWQVLIAKSSLSKRKSLDGQNLIGGGSILNKKWVLSAAHVFDDGKTEFDRPRNIVLFAGITERPSGQTVEESVVAYSIKNYHGHEDYNNETFKNDIALIEVGYKLDDNLRPNETEISGFTFGKSIQQVYLPSKGACSTEPLHSYDQPLLREGTEVIVTGFGHTSVMIPGVNDKGFNPPRILQQASLQIASKITCREHIEQIKINNTQYDALEFTESMLCTQPAKRDACKGDSGGPLVRKVEDEDTEETRWVQVGIVSFGYGCAWKHPGYYTKVASFIPWINQKIKAYTVVDTTVHRTTLNMYPTPTDLWYEVHSNVSLHCSWEHNSRHTVEVRWKDGTSVGLRKIVEGDEQESYAYSRSLPSPDRQIEVHNFCVDVKDGEMKQQYSELTIINITFQDSTRYHCIVEVGAGEVEKVATFEVNLYALPIITVLGDTISVDIHPPVETTSEEAYETNTTKDGGDDWYGDERYDDYYDYYPSDDPSDTKKIVIICEIEGAYPEPSVSFTIGETETVEATSVTWNKRVEKEPYTGTATLELTADPKYDGKSVTCSAILPTVPKTEVLRYGTSPRIEILYDATSVTTTISPSTAKAGDEVQIRCDSNGNPPPSFHVESDVAGQPSFEKSADGKMFTIASVIESDAGNYYCVATLPSRSEDDTEVKTLRSESKQHLDVQCASGMLDLMILIPGNRYHSNTERNAYKDWLKSFGNYVTTSHTYTLSIYQYGMEFYQNRWHNLLESKLLLNVSSSLQFQSRIDSLNLTQQQAYPWFYPGTITSVGAASLGRRNCIARKKILIVLVERTIEWDHTNRISDSVSCMEYEGISVYFIGVTSSYSGDTSTFETRLKAITGRLNRERNFHMAEIQQLAQERSIQSLTEFIEKRRDYCGPPTSAPGHRVHGVKCRWKSSTENTFHPGGKRFFECMRRSLPIWVERPWYALCKTDGTWVFVTKNRCERE